MILISFFKEKPKHFATRSQWKKSLEYQNNTSEEMRLLFSDFLFMSLALANALFLGFVMDLGDTLKILVRGNAEYDKIVDVSVPATYYIPGAASLLLVSVFLASRPHRYKMI